MQRQPREVGFHTPKSAQHVGNGSVSAPTGSPHSVCCVRSAGYSYVATSLGRGNDVANAGAGRGSRLLSSNSKCVPDEGSSAVSLSTLQGRAAVDGIPSGPRMNMQTLRLVSSLNTDIDEQKLFGTVQQSPGEEGDDRKRERRGSQV